MGGKLLLPWNLTCQFTCPLPPFLPQLQRPHRLRCFTQPMKCLKDTESVSGHGFLSARLPGGTRLSLSVSCMHSSSSAWIYTGGLVAPMYNQPSSSLRYSPYTHSHTWRPRSVCAVLYAVSKQPSSPTALDLKIDICFLDIQAFMFLSLLRVDAWIVHEHYWLLPGSLGSLGSITAGKSACSLLRATPHECWVYHKKGTVTIGITVQTENVSHSSSENLL